MDIDDALYKAQLQQLQLMLEGTLKKNLMFFKQRVPSIYEMFKSYTPTKIQLRVADEGYLNLYNTDTGKPVYPSDPQTFCQEYVDQYVEKPSFLKISLSKAKVLDEENVHHVHLANKAIDQMSGKGFRTASSGLEKTTNAMLLNGIGMGYLIPQLLAETKIKHLIVVEPHKDVFFGSLQLVDWEAVYQEFSSDHQTVKLVIGESAHKTAHKLRQHFNLIGMFNAINCFYLDHLSSPEMKEAIQTFFTQIRSLLSAQGYFDDERVGIAHTIENLRRNTPVLHESCVIPERTNGLPVFVIANGPSLDRCKDYLIENQENAIIISCGTTIGSLNALGIKPDFHIEMERTRPVVEWLTASTDSEYRKDITLLALNTVHPEVLALFDTKGIGLKSNDIGTQFVSQQLKANESAINLVNCNPTVTNAGLVFAISMGFNNIYLFGLDLGFSAGEQHHASTSTHYKISEEHQKNLHLYSKDQKGNTELPGNFGDTITTTSVYQHAKLSIESALRSAKSVQCFNTSYGLAIEGAQPLECKDIPTLSPLENKAETVKSIFKAHFSDQLLEPIAKNNRLLKRFSPANNTLTQVKVMLKRNFKDWDLALNVLMDIHMKLVSFGRANERDFGYGMLKGSLSYFNGILAGALYSCDTREEGLALFNEIKPFYIELCDRCMHTIEHSFFELDNKTRDLANNLH